MRTILIFLSLTLASSVVAARGRDDDGADRRGRRGRGNDDTTGSIGTTGDDTTGSIGTGTGNGGPGRSRSAPPGRARSPLVKPVGAVDPNAKGRVEVRSKGDRQRLTIQAEQLDPGLEVDFLLEDELGQLQVVATRTVNAAGQARVRFETRKGGLPLGADNLAELEGRAIEVRTAAGEPLLAGAVPSDSDGPGFGTSFRVRGEIANVDRDFAPDGKVEVKLEFVAARGRSKFEVEIEDVPAGAEFHLFLRDAGGAFVEVGSLTANSLGQAEIEFDTNDGNALPLGASDPSALFGVDAELRSPDGTVRFAGALPSA